MPKKPNKTRIPTADVGRYTHRGAPGEARDAELQSAAKTHPKRVADQDKGFITRSGLVAFGAVAAGTVAAAAAWAATTPPLAMALGIFAALGAAAALHELLPKHW